MRMYDITMLIICFELALQVVAGSGLFLQVYYPPSQQNILQIDGYTTGATNASSLLDSAKQQNADYFSVGMWLFNGFNLFIQTISSVIWFLPHLISVFGFPMLLAIPVQCLIWLSYMWGIVQLLTGRAGGLMQ